MQRGMGGKGWDGGRNLVTVSGVRGFVRGLGGVCDLWVLLCARVFLGFVVWCEGIFGVCCLVPASLAGQV